MKTYDKIIFELSTPNRIGYRLPDLDVEAKDVIPNNFLRETDIELPEVSELDVVRHFTNLSDKNYSVDKGFYPLGSCTMKYNPRINEEVAGYDGFSNIHPLQDESTVQGALELMYKDAEALAEVAGMDKVTLQPAAGAHGELTGMLIIKEYHASRNDNKRTKVIVPDSAHGTNPATVTMTGYDVLEVKSNDEGKVSIDSLKEVVEKHKDEIAGLMLTNPNTLGIFESDIKKIAELVHDAGGLLYYDGANANAILGQARAGDMGFDVIHFNVHKTFSTPHGGGGPGSGPVGVKDFLVDFLPKPTVEKKDDLYYLDYDRPKSIGKVKDFYGHFGVSVKTYSYILTMGADGLKRASEVAVLNSNYMANKLKEYYNLPKGKVFKHEFVLSGIKNNLTVTTLDIAKRLLDFGFHPPTVYFPLIINQAMMIEPTETESKETLDNFIDALIKISKEAKENPSLLKDAPHSTVVRRPDETRAARNPILRYIKAQK